MNELEKPLNALNKLKYQRDKLSKKIQALEQREKTQERKKDARRKILIGSYIIDKARSEDKMSELISELNSYLKRNSDRKLFDLEEI